MSWFLSRVVLGSWSVLTAIGIAAMVVGGCGRSGDLPVENGAPRLTGPYMDQPAPGLIPTKFLGDVLDHSFCSVFSPDGDEYFFTRYDPDSGACSIEFMAMTDGVWGRPEVAPFSSEFTDNDIGMSSDGNRVVFRSNRPLPGDPAGAKRENLFIWTSERTGMTWSDPEVVAFRGRTDIPGGYPALTDGGYLFFTANAPGKSGPKDIYRSRIENGAFGEAEPMGEPPNSSYGEGDLFVAPDGSFLIVSCYDHPGNTGDDSLDLWVSFRKKENGWTDPVNLGPPINTEFGENCPMVSPDGKYLFFNRYTGEEGRPENGTYWVDAEILDQYRPGQSPIMISDGSLAS